MRHSIKEITPSDAAIIVQMYQEGHALKIIREKVDVTDGVIYVALRRYGIKPKRMTPHKRNKRSTVVSGESKGESPEMGMFHLSGEIRLILKNCRVVGMKQGERLTVVIKGD